MCFFTRGDNPWRYESPVSLDHYEGLMGYVAKYSYGAEVDHFLKRKSAQDRVLELKGNNPHPRLLKLVYSGRIKVFVEDRNIVSWTLNQSRELRLLEYNIRNAGCLAEQPFYLALYKRNAWSKKFIDLLDQAFADPANLKIRREIERHYVGQ